jgi:hypothetical protein
MKTSASMIVKMPCPIMLLSSRVWKKILETLWSWPKQRLRGKYCRDIIKTLQQETFTFKLCLKNPISESWKWSLATRMIWLKRRTKLFQRCFQKPKFFKLKFKTKPTVANNSLNSWKAKLIRWMSSKKDLMP